MAAYSTSAREELGRRAAENKPPLPEVLLEGRGVPRLANDPKFMTASHAQLRALARITSNPIQLSRVTDELSARLFVARKRGIKPSPELIGIGLDIASNPHARNCDRNRADNLVNKI